MLRKFVALSIIAICLSGCGGSPSAPVSKLPSDLGVNNNTPASNPGENPSAGNSNTGTSSAGSSAPAPVRTDAFGNPITERERPRAAMGGGGGPPPSGPAPSSNSGSNVAANNPAPRGATGMANGFFPQGMTFTSGTSAPLVGGMNNGFFPQVATSAPAGNSPQRPVPAAGGGAPAGNSSRTGNNNAGGGRPNSGVATDSGGTGSPGTNGSDNEYFEAAKELFGKGEEVDAIRNVYAYMLSDDEAFAEYPLEYVKGLKKPKLMLRIGVGVAYTGPKGFDEKPPVIGDPLPEEGNNNVPGAGSGDILGASGAGASTTSNSPYSSVESSNPAGFLMYYTGDYVDRLYMELNSRRKDSPPRLGKILAQFDEPTPSTAGGPSTPAADNSTFVPGLGGSAGRNLPTPAAGGGGAPAGGPAPAAGGGNPNAGGENANRNRGNRNTKKLLDIWRGGTASAPERLTIGTLLPGVICLGSGKTEELLSRATAYDVDLLLVFGVQVKEARGQHFSMTTLGLYDPNGEKPAERLTFGRQLRNTTVMENRKSGRGDDVMTELNKVLDYIEENFKMEALPTELKPEQAENRINKALSGNIHDPLAAAVEVVGFYRIGVLAEEKARDSLIKLFGEGGDVLLDGDAGERKKVIDGALSQDVIR